VILLHFKAQDALEIERAIGLTFTPWWLCKYVSLAPPRECYVTTNAEWYTVYREDGLCRPEGDA
jgi:hypothetical protein